MGTAKIIDTNVPITAVTTGAGIPLACKLACVNTMKQILSGEILVLLDVEGDSLREYRQQMYPDPNPSAGLASQFLMYLFNHQFDTTRVQRVSIPKLVDGSYQHFPKDKELEAFDLSDRKWVAIAIKFEEETSSKSPVVNATDSDWLHFEDALGRVGIQIDFLCKEILKPKDE